MKKLELPVGMKFLLNYGKENIQPIVYISYNKFFISIWNYFYLQQPGPAFGPQTGGKLDLPERLPIKDFLLLTSEVNQMLSIRKECPLMDFF